MLAPGFGMPGMVMMAASPTLHAQVHPFGVLPVGQSPQGACSPAYQHGPRPALRPRDTPPHLTAAPPQQFGVGIFFQQDAGSNNIYVASIVPGGAAWRDSRIRISDELVGVNSVQVGPTTTLEDLRTHILGERGTSVLLSLRRPGGTDGEGARDESWFFEVELQRGDPSDAASTDPVDMPRHKAPPSAQREGPLPAEYEVELSNLRKEVEELRQMPEQDLPPDPRVLELEGELAER